MAATAIVVLIVGSMIACNVDIMASYGPQVGIRLVMVVMHAMWTSWPAMALRHKIALLWLLLLMVTRGSGHQQGCLADQLLTGLGQLQINPRGQVLRKKKCNFW
jgi:hypothetical protein